MNTAAAEKTARSAPLPVAALTARARRALGGEVTAPPRRRAKARSLSAAGTTAHENPFAGQSAPCAQKPVRVPGGASGRTPAGIPKIILCLMLSALLAACTTMADYDYAEIDANMAAGDFAAVQSELEVGAKSLYSARDEVLRLLDTGLVAHFAGGWDGSNEALASAEALIDTYSAKSVSQLLASFVTNDLVQDYAGEEFEDIYTNLFMALNYIALGSTEDAMVEIRRFDTKLKEFRHRYQQQVYAANEDSEVKIETVSIQFSDSALARYLSMILYRAAGEADEAAVDLKYLREAFDAQPDLYGFPVPECVDADAAPAPEGMARLNVLAFYGRSPVKSEVVTRLYYPEAGLWYKLALPVMLPRPSSITSAYVTAVSRRTGEAATAELGKIESIEAIAQDTFRQHYSIIRAKALARSVSRAAASTTFDVLAAQAEAEERYDMSFIYSLLGMAAKLTTETMERADVRACRFLPGNAAVAGLTLAPGDYDVTVRFLNGNTIVRTETKTLTVHAGRLNLMEAACFQ